MSLLSFTVDTKDTLTSYAFDGTWGGVLLLVYLTICVMVVLRHALNTIFGVLSNSRISVALANMTATLNEHIQSNKARLTEIATKIKAVQPNGIATLGEPVPPSLLPEAVPAPAKDKP